MQVSVIEGVVVIVLMCKAQLPTTSLSRITCCYAMIVLYSNDAALPYNTEKTE
jgi:hypothetical protein